jgi:prepilin-type processing-associated H-X9-DG protein
MSSSSEYDPDFGHIQPKTTPRSRFGLLRLLAALAGLVLLLLFFSPIHRSGGAREAARRSACTNNLKQLALAMLDYEQKYHALPPAYTVDAEGRPLHSWRTLILPFLEQEPLYESIDLAKPWDDPANAEALAHMPTWFRCPGLDAPPNATTYLALVGPDACLRPDRPRALAEITDPHEATLMVIEAPMDRAVPWMAPSDADAALFLGFRSGSRLAHEFGVNVVFVDGSAHFTKTNLDGRVGRALVTIDGGDPPLPEW